MIKRMLTVFGIIVFVICFILAIYNGVAQGRLGATGKDDFDFGLFLLGFIKYVAMGLVGGGVLLGVGKLCPEY